MQLLQIDGVLLLTRQNGTKLISVERKKKGINGTSFEKVENSIKSHVTGIQKAPFVHFHILSGYSNLNIYKDSLLHFYTVYFKV